MISKKTKQILAQVLVVSIMLPNLNVQALENENPTSIVENLNNKTEEISIQENTEASKVEESTSNAKEESLDNSSENASEELDVSNDNSNLLDSQNEVLTLTEENLDNFENVTTLEESQDADTENNSIQGKTYEKRKVIDSRIRTFSAFEENDLTQEREEFRLKQEAIENLEVLVPMTDENYELTIANADGSYEFVEAYSDVDSAIEAANAIDSRLRDSQQPAVINAEGRVVYSTYQMARILRHVNGENISGNVNIYSDAGLTSAFTYVNQAYIEDAPILDMTDNASKVMISGYIGWINSNKSTGTYDMEVVPLNQAKNPSYYTVKDGELWHFISYDLTGNSGFSRLLGKAPNMLREGARYLSYDGQYFYEYDYNNQESISNTLNVLIDNYRNGNRNNSINNGNPYYLYYLNLPFRSQTIYSAQDLDNFINNHPKIKGTNSKLIGLGSTFKEIEATYGVNAMLALAISMNESNCGNSTIAQTKNNLFGLKAYDSSAAESASTFASPRDSVIDFAKNYISRGYADPADWRYFGGYLGNKNRGANVKYASDPFWGEKAANYAYEIDRYLSGGNSNLRDTNSKQIGMARSDNSVIKRDGTLLYNIGNDITKYAGYIDTPFIISDVQKVNINGNQYYEIYPERNTPVGNGGAANKYHGNYDWNDRGYISVNNVSLINTFVPAVEVKYGQSRYETAVELSKGTISSAETIVITNGEALADGLTATPIASYYNSPIVLVNKTYIPNTVKDEIKRLGAKNVIIVGGTGSVAPEVENELRNLGISKITRLGGATRYDTALQVARFIDENLYDVENVVIANGYALPDALSIASVSGRDRMPILLVSDTMSSDVYGWMQSESLNNAFIVGGTGSVSNQIMNDVNGITSQDIANNRLGGSDRYDTNAKVIERFFGESVEKAYITEGVVLADALTAGPIAASSGSFIVISDSSLSNTQKAVLKNKSTNKIIQVGGIVSKNAVENLKELLSTTK